jgi:hypothetical protein
MNLGPDSKTAVSVVPDSTNRMRFSDGAKRTYQQLLSGGAASSNMFSKVGEPCFFNGGEVDAQDKNELWTEHALADPDFSTFKTK